MAKIGWLLVAWSWTAYAMHMSLSTWPAGKTLSDYLKEHRIPASVLETIGTADRKYLMSVRPGVSVYELKEDNGTLVQALIPVGDTVQMHLFRRLDGTYRLDILPVLTQDTIYFARIPIVRNPYHDLLQTIRNEAVADRLSLALRGAIKTSILKPGDTLALLYRQKERLGKVYGLPSVLIARIDHRGKSHYIYVDSEGRGHQSPQRRIQYTVKGKKRIASMVFAPDTGAKRFAMPLRRVRITSRFTHRRWHPVLHRYRPHHGVDFGAKRGTPILAVNDGKVVYAGWMRGYGKTVKIKHGGGYLSLYAHQSRIRVKRGRFVKRGQIIGYVGNTGRSTGPHLHLGIMKNGRWIDPLRVIRRVSVAYGQRRKKVKRYRYQTVPIQKSRTVDIKKAKRYKTMLDRLIEQNASTYVWPKSAFNMNVGKEVDLNAFFDD